MRRSWNLIALAASLALMPLVSTWAAPGKQDAPLPKIIQPGDAGAPPSDAIVLFDGSNLDAWQKRNGEDAGWVIQDGVMLAVTGQGPVVSRQHFGDVQLHVEFATPSAPQGSGQGRGNSGVYLQARYEVQVLDSFENETYPDGQCGAIYGQHPPLVNASRGPGEWQTYDIVFRGARFDGAGTKTANATMTVFHNGVLIQDHATVSGITAAAMNQEGPGPGPVYLQDHGNPVRYRNIWLREL